MPALSVWKETQVVRLTHLSGPGGQGSRYPRGSRSWDLCKSRPLSGLLTLQPWRGCGAFIILEAPGFFARLSPRLSPPPSQLSAGKDFEEVGWRACRFPLPSWALSFSCSSAPACRTDSCLHPNLPAPIVGDPSLCIPLLGRGAEPRFSGPPPPWKARQGNYFWNKSGYTTNELFISGHGGEEAFCWAS